MSHPDVSMAQSLATEHWWFIQNGAIRKNPFKVGTKEHRAYENQISRMRGLASMQRGY